jgi:hypothetical protein
MKLPEGIGPLSGAVVDLLRGAPDPTSLAAPVSRWPLGTGGALHGASDLIDPLDDRDLQLALALGYELHFQGIDDVDPGWEWDGAQLTLRSVLEEHLLRGLRDVTARAGHDAVADQDDSAEVDLRLREIVGADDGPSLSGHLLRKGTVEDFRDLLTQRSVYHLREADAHTFAIPRLAGAPKAALVEIQSDEYGNGRAPRMHATMFAASMRALGLDDQYGSHLVDATAPMLTTLNVMSLFGLHRRWRGALVGHLAALEMTSTTPNRRYANGLRRLGFGPDGTAFFDEHVEADAVHEQVASVDLAAGLVRDEPWLRADVLWGARCCLAVDGLFATAMLERVAARAAAPAPTGVIDLTGAAHVLSA